MRQEISSFYWRRESKVQSLLFHKVDKTTLNKKHSHGGQRKQKITSIWDKDWNYIGERWFAVTPLKQKDAEASTVIHSTTPHINSCAHHSNKGVFGDILSASGLFTSKHFNLWRGTTSRRWDCVPLPCKRERCTFFESHLWAQEGSGPAPCAMSPSQYGSRIRRWLCMMLVSPSVETRRYLFICMYLCCCRLLYSNTMSFLEPSRVVLFVYVWLPS